MALLILLLQILGLFIASAARVAARIVVARRLGHSPEAIIVGFGRVLFKTPGRRFEVRLLPIWLRARFGQKLDVPRRDAASEPASAGARAVFVLGGPLGAYVAAFVLSFGALLLGGSAIPTTTMRVVDGPARLAGLVDGDQIVGVGGKRISAWAEILAIVGESGGRPLMFRVQRQGSEFELEVQPAHVNGRWMVGVQPKAERQFLGVRQAASRALEMPWLFPPASMFRSSGAAPFSGGASSAGETPVVPRWFAYAQWLALWCAFTAVCGLLPLPGFDGLLLVLLLAEGTQGILPSQRWARAAQSPQWGVSILVLLMIATRIGVRIRDRLHPEPAPQLAEALVPPPLSADRFPQRFSGAPRGQTVTLPLTPSEAEIARYVAEVELVEWYGLFVGSKKIGFGRSVSRRTREGEKGGFLLATDMATRITAEGEADNIYEFEARYYEGAAPFRLIVLESTEMTVSSKTTRRISFDARGGTVTEIIDGVSAEERRIGPTRETLSDALGSSAIDVARVEPGQRATYVEFSEEHLKDDVLEVSVTDKRRRVLAGIELPVAEIRLIAQSDQATVKIVFASNGRWVEMTVNDSIMLRPAPRAAAIELVDSWDAILAGPAVDQAIGDPARVTSLRLLVRAPDDLVIPDLPRQKVSARPAGERLVELRAASGGEVTAEERAQALAPSASIDSDSSEIRRTADEITRALTSSRAKAEALLAYVFETLTKTYQTNLSTATHVLRRKAGDCSEHAVLFVALARAAGIPAREVSGLVYTDVDQRFGWHAWVEVEIDGRWQPMDPVFGQRVADATHLALSTGTDAQWMKAVDRLQIRVAPP